MFERFTRDARAAVVLAQEEARELGARAIGPEHLLRRRAAERRRRAGRGAHRVRPDRQTRCGHAF